MNLKQTSIAVAMVGLLATGMTSCKSQEKKDAEAKAKIEAAAPGVMVEVKDGVATLNGQFADDASKMAAEEAAKKVDGVKSVVNNTTVAAAPAPVIVNPDEALTASVNAIVKGFAGVTATVNQGVVTLNGELKRADLPALMKAVNAINPKKVENKLILK